MGTKIMLYLAVIAMVVTAVGGFFAFHKAQLQSLEDKLEFKQAEVDNLKTENEALEVSNASLIVEIKNANDNRVMVEVELEILRSKDMQAQETIAEYERKINDKKRNDRLTAIRKGDKASLLLLIANKNVKCETKHMEDEGTCRSGHWLPAKKAAAEVTQ